MRLDEAIRLALQRNERGRAAPLQIEIAEGQKERARAGFLPTLALGGTSTIRPSSDRNTSNPTSSGTLTLTQPLLNPSAIPLYDQARHNLASAQFGSTEAQRILAFDTARALLQTLANEQVRDAAVDRLARARANLDNAQARAEAQLNSINDATRARVDQATAQRDVANATASFRRSQIQLAFLIGQPVEGSVEAPEALGQAAVSFKAESGQLATQAYDRRPDVLGLRQDIEAARAFAREPLYRMIPSVGLTGQVRGDPNPQNGARAFDESLSLSLSWTIFDGGARYGDLRTRRAQAENLVLNEQLLKRSVDTAIKQAIVSLEAAREAFAAAEAGAAAAKVNSEETAILYQQGLARAIELTDANGRRFDADIALAQARLALSQSYLDLRFAVGVWPLEDQPPSGFRTEARRAAPPTASDTATARVEAPARVEGPLSVRPLPSLSVPLRLEAPTRLGARPAVVGGAQLVPPTVARAEARRSEVNP